jgi:hypothetical protein
MADFYVVFGNDVQPYICKLASEHIGSLRVRCDSIAAKVLASRKRRRRVALITPRINRSMLDGKALHCFEMFGFDFALRENAKPNQRKLEFVLNFAATPDFEPEDMPERLRRVDGKALSARPTRRRRPQAARPQRAAGTRKGRGKKRSVERTSYRIPGFSLWIHAQSAALASSLAAKLYKMHDTYQRLSDRVAAMWRRRPRFGFKRAGTSLLTSVQELEAHAPIRARLEPRLIGESLRLLIFTLVTPEPPIDWSAYPFGQPADEGERIAV